MANRQLVYVGTYTQADSEGIYVYELNAGSGALNPVGAPIPLVDPTFLTTDLDGTHLYAVSEVSEFGGQVGGAVSAFRIDRRTGGLELLNHQPTLGEGPCHVSVAPNGRAVFVANYGSGSVTMLPIESDGRVGASIAHVQHEGSSVNPERQEGPHAHSITPSPDGRYVVAADLGLDKVFIYAVDYENGGLVRAEQPWASVRDGAGPRHVAFDPNGRHAYVINELDSTMTAFDFDAGTGMLTEIQTISTLPSDFNDTNYPADVHVSPGGSLLYGSNRGHDSIVVYDVDSETGMLSAVGYESTQGKGPRNFGIDLTGNFLLAANQETHTIVSFRVGKASGRPAPAGVITSVSMPVCLVFLHLPE